MRRLLFVLSILALALLPLPAQVSVRYQVKDLGVLPGWVESHAFGVNWLGQVTGSVTDATSDPNCHAFLWNSLTGMRDIGTAGDPAMCAQGRAVDAFGRVAGYLVRRGTQPEVLRTFFYSPGGPLIDIGALHSNAPTTSAVFRDMNNRGEIVGFSHEREPAIPNSLAFYWSRQTQMVALASLGPEASSIAQGINDSGRIVGYGGTGFQGPPHAFYMASRTSPMADLAAKFFPSASGQSYALFINSRNQVAGDYQEDSTRVSFFIPDPDASTIHFTANLGLTGGVFVTKGMNEAGQVVGICNPSLTEPAPVVQSFRWAPEKPIEILSPLTGDAGSEPVAINLWGQVVGNSSTAGPPIHAVLWKAGATAATALPAIEAAGECRATNINDLGVISGTCWRRGVPHAVIWTPQLTLGRESN